MAEAHRGYAVGQDARLRLLLGVIDSAEDERSPSQLELQVSTGLSKGSLLHHIEMLEKQGHLEQLPGSRGLRLTEQGIKLLLRAGLVEPVGQRTVYAITARGVQLLERAAKPEDREAGGD